MSFSTQHNDYLDPDKHLWDQESQGENLDIIFPDADDCYCIGVDDSEIRIGIAEDTNGLWFYEITFDTAHSVDSTILGPFESYEDAGFDAISIANTWFVDNDFTSYELEDINLQISGTLDAIRLDNAIIKQQKA